ncbi:MAG: hypothetical protein V4485_05870 [Pseudomonadota bacterium]
MRFVHYTVIIFISLLLSGCAKTTSIRHSANYLDNLRGSKEIIILPPKVEINMVDTGGRRERMYDYEDHLAKVVEQQAKEVMSKIGYRVKALHKKDLHEQKLMDHTMALTHTYDTAREELYGSVLWKEDVAFSINKPLSPEVILLGSAVKGDIFLMIDYVGSIKTNGARAVAFAMSLLTGVGAENADNAAMIVGLIDAKTGAVIWSNIVSESHCVITSAVTNLSSQDKIEIARLDRMLERVFQPLRADLSKK